MSETTLPKRQAVDQQLTWDLTPIFNDDFAYTEAGAGLDQGFCQDVSRQIDATSCHCGCIS